MSYILHRLWGDFKGMFFPRTCRICNEPLVAGEDVLCLNCIQKIPFACITPGVNPLEHKIADPAIPIERAASLFYYTHTSPYARLLRDAKYNGQPEIDAALARICAQTLLPCGFFNGIDLIVPVPIHWLKRLRRGFNQGDFIAAGLSEITGIRIADDLLRASAHSPQAGKSIRERRDYSDSVFSLSRDTSRYCPAHILLVDDVITTGSTILRCASLLHAAFPTARISLLSLATTPGN